jgi:hypothetical protein
VLDVMAPELPTRNQIDMDQIILGLVLQQEKSKAVEPLVDHLNGLGSILHATYCSPNRCGGPALYAEAKDHYESLSP